MKRTAGIVTVFDNEELPAYFNIFSEFDLVLSNLQAFQHIICVCVQVDVMRNASSIHTPSKFIVNSGSFA